MHAVHGRLAWVHAAASDQLVWLIHEWVNRRLVVTRSVSWLAMTFSI
jgi:hypothetical protein